VRLGAAVERRVRGSVLLVSANSCEVTRTGTGWVADSGLVMTAAHVVRAARDGRVQDANGTWHYAETVTVNSTYDVAMLRVRTLQAGALEFGRGTRGDSAVVFGHPGGGDLRMAPARIDDVDYLVTRGAAIAARHILVLDARLAHGDSGAPLVDTSGDVMGVVLSIGGKVAYALAADDAMTAIHELPRAAARVAPC
jgi:S1-C subfamily serine protease